MGPSGCYRYLMNSNASQCIKSVEGGKRDCQLHRGEVMLLFGLKCILKIAFSKGIIIKCLLLLKCYY